MRVCSYVANAPAHRKTVKARVMGYTTKCKAGGPILAIPLLTFRTSLKKQIRPLHKSFISSFNLKTLSRKSSLLHVSYFYLHIMYTM